MPTIGEVAPDFTLPNQDGKPINLRSYRGQKVVIFVFLKAGGEDCTIHASGFRDHHAEITAAGAVVFGISAPPQADLKAWHQTLKLPFDLLSDEDHLMLDAWGAWSALSFKGRSFAAPLRSYWVIDDAGTVIAGQVRIGADASVTQALEALHG